MTSRTRTASAAGFDYTSQPPAQRMRLEAHAAPAAEATHAAPAPAPAQPPPPPPPKPERVFVVQRVKKQRPTDDWKEDDEGERQVHGTFVGLANANREVRRIMMEHMGEWGLNPSDEDLSLFDKGCDEYRGRPAECGTKVGSSWEYDDGEDILEVYVLAYPLLWPEDCDDVSSSEEEDGEEEEEEDEEVVEEDEVEDEEDEGADEGPRTLDCDGTGCGHPRCRSCWGDIGDPPFL